MKTPITILSTAAGAMFMPGFFSCLRENGERQIRIVGTDAAPLDHMNRVVDAFYQVSPYSDPAYIDEILSIAEREKVDIVFPQISGELGLFAEARERFDKRGIKLAISNPETLATANNKLELYRIMQSKGLTTPAFAQIKDPAEFDEVLHRLGYPEKEVCVKIADGSGSRGVRIVSGRRSETEIFLTEKPSSLYISADDMRRIVRESAGRATLYAMECLQMPEYTVDLLADHGSTVAIGGRLNTVSNMSIAMQSETREIPEAYGLCRQIVQLLRLNGNIGFDFMFNAEGRVRLTDLNPRITATIVLYERAGINFPYLRVLQLMGEALPESHLRQGVRLIRNYHDIIL